MYSQNQEEKYILDYFHNQPGNLLSVGENDGKTFSNALALIEQGWTAVLIEPSREAFEKMCLLHDGNDNVTCLNVALSGHTGKQEFYESGTHLGKGDTALLSSLSEEETRRWKDTEFTKREVPCYTYRYLLGLLGDIPPFDFITIDAEGMDIVILKQIDLTETQLLCIEWNNNFGTRDIIKHYCSQFGLKRIIYESGENIIIGR